MNHYQTGLRRRSEKAGHRKGVKQWIFSILLILTLAIPVLAGCSEQAVAPLPDATTPPTSNEPVAIGFGVLGFQRSLYEPLVQAFNEQHPNIRVQLVSLDEIFNIGGGGSVHSIEQIMRDVARAADTAIPIFPVRPEDIANGYLYDLKPLMDADPSFNANDFYPHALDPMGAEGGIYMLPDLLPVPVLSYNKDLWLASGLAAPAPNWTWHDLTATAEQLARKQGDTVSVYGLMLSGGSVALLSELSASGVDIFGTPLEQIHITDPEYQAAIERIHAMANSGGLYLPLTESGVMEYNVGKAEELLQDGKIAIWMPSLLSNRPDSPPPGFDVGTLVFPYNSGSPIFYFGMPIGTIMSSGTQHPNEAWAWLSFLSRQEKQQPFITAGAITQIPARRSLAEQSGYWQKLDQETAAVVRAALDLPSPELPAGLTSELNDKVEILDRALSQVVSGKVTSIQALQDGQDALNKRVAERQLTPQPTPDTMPIVVATLEPQTIAADATEISFATLWLGAEELRRMARTFHQEHPDIAVNVTNIGNVGIDSSDPPNLSETAKANDCFFWYGEPRTEELASTLDLQPFIDADPTFRLDDYPAVFLQAYREGTGLYGLPYAANLSTLLYNQTAFDQAGQSYPTIDWTLNDLLAAAEQLDTGGNEAERRYGFAEMATSFFFLNRFNASVVQQNGDAVVANFTDPKLLEALTYYLALLRDYSPNKELPGYRQGEWSSEIYQLTGEGRVGMWINQGGFFQGMGTNASRDFTTASAPLPFGNGPITDDDVTVRGFHISATTSQPQACWQWIRYLSDTTSMLQGSFPARLSLVESALSTGDLMTGQADTFRAYQTRLAATNSLAPGQNLPRDFDSFWLMQAIDRALQGGNLEQELTRAEEITNAYLTCVEAGESKHLCATQADPAYEGFNVAPESDEQKEE